MANLQQSKANRIKVINSFPTSGMGKEGDIMIANISGKGTYLCTKAGMRWYAADRLNELGRLKTPKLDDLTVTSLKVNNLSIKEKSTGAEIDLSKGDFTLDVDVPSKLQMVALSIPVIFFINITINSSVRYPLTLPSIVAPLP